MGNTDYEPTPVISPHARARCAEMGISTKIAKRIWKTRMLTRPARGVGERIMALSPEYPDYCLVVATRPDPPTPDNRPLVVSVVFNCDEDYVREGTGYRVVGAAGGGA